MIVDKNNNEVKIGAWVKVLFIEPGFIDTFPPDHAKIMKTMINKNFEVISFAHGKALVNQPFDKLQSFSLALDSSEMELVLNGTKKTNAK